MKLPFNKKLYFKLVLLITGSFLILDLAFIMAFNMFMESRAADDSSGVILTDVQQDEDTRKEDTEETGVDRTGEQKEEPDKVPEGQSEGNRKIRIELINYTGVEDIGRQVRATLEANNYQVVLSNGKSNQPVKTSVIERRDIGAGLDIQQLLGMGEIIKAFDEGSEFDVRVEIGHDYLP